MRLPPGLLLGPVVGSPVLICLLLWVPLVRKAEYGVRLCGVRGNMSVLLNWGASLPFLRHHSCHPAQPCSHLQRLTPEAFHHIDFGCGDQIVCFAVVGCEFLRFALRLPFRSAVGVSHLILSATSVSPGTPLCLTWLTTRHPYLIFSMQVASCA